jgi:chromosome partitioning protein
MRRAEASGERVILIDTDPQASAWAWSQARTEDTPSVEKATVPTLARVMDRAEQNRATLAVIDTAPHAAPRCGYHCGRRGFLADSLSPFCL